MQNVLEFYIVADVSDYSNVGDYDYDCDYCLNKTAIMINKDGKDYHRF